MTLNRKINKLLTDLTIFSLTHRQTHTKTDTLTHTSMLTYTDTRTCTHTHTHAHTHTLVDENAWLPAWQGGIRIVVLVVM